MKWSFVVKYRFDEFLDFIHNTQDIIIQNIEMNDLYLNNKDPNRGHYVVEFYIINRTPKQLTLF